MKTQKGSIQISLIIAIIVGILIVGGGSYLSVTQYQEHRAEKVAEQAEADALIEAQRVALEETQIEIEKLKQQTTEAQARQVALEQKVISEQQKNKDLSLLIKEWRPRIAKLTCSWNLSTGPIIGFGSGLLIMDGVVATNQHVVTFEIGNRTYKPSSCNISFPENSEIFQSNDFDTIASEVIFGRGIDIAGVFIESNTALSNLAAKEVPWCKSKAAIGDKVVVLGYPAIGSQNEITATEGIISGYDGYHYITSAKIDKGNSGGVSILLKNNCYLGIPTEVAVGEIESLGRILDSRIIYDSKYFEKYPNGL